MDMVLVGTVIFGIIALIVGIVKLLSIIMR